MNKLTKLSLFLSSYTPLFLIISISYMNFGMEIELTNNITNNIINVISTIVTTNVISIISLIIPIISNIFFIISYKNSSFSKKTWTIKKVENKTSDILNYSLTFIVALISTDIFKLTEIKGILCFLIIMTIMYSVYVNSNLLYLNPSLSFFGVKIYEAELDNKNSIIILSKKTYKNGDIIQVKRITKGLYKN